MGARAKGWDRHFSTLQASFLRMKAFCRKKVGTCQCRRERIYAFILHSVTISSPAVSFCEEDQTFSRTIDLTTKVPYARKAPSKSKIYKFVILL